MVLLVCIVSLVKQERECFTFRSDLVATFIIKENRN